MQRVFTEKRIRIPEGIGDDAAISWQGSGFFRVSMAGLGAKKPGSGYLFEELGAVVLAAFGDCGVLIDLPAAHVELDLLR